MKKLKSRGKDIMRPDSNAVEGIPSQDPYEQYKKMDANFKKRRGGSKKSYKNRRGKICPRVIDIFSRLIHTKL